MNKDIELIRRLNKDWQEGKIKIKKAGGQTNRNYIVEFKKKKYFVRLPWTTDVINRGIEGKNILALCGNRKIKKILPEYYVYICKGKNIIRPNNNENFDLPDGTMMMEYIPGRVFNMSLFKKKDYQERLARMFYTFHTSGVPFVNEYNVFRDEIKKYRIAVQKYHVKKVIDDKIITKLEKIEKEAQKAIPFLKRRVPAHNDFILQNFLIGDDNNIYLLDFEYAGSSEKGGFLYDFGFLFNDNLFRNPPMTKIIFDKFLDIADRIYKKHLDRKQIYLLASAVCVMQVWWGLLRYFSVKTKREKQYFKKYVLDRARRIDKLYSF